MQWTLHLYYTDTPMLHSLDSEIFRQTSLPKKSEARPSTTLKTAATWQFFTESGHTTALTRTCLWQIHPLLSQEQNSSGRRFFSSPDSAPSSPKTSISTLERLNPACLFRALPGICPFGQPFFAGFGALWRAALAAQQSATSPQILGFFDTEFCRPLVHKVLLVHAGRLTHRVFFHKASLSQAVYSMSFWESFSKKKKSQTSLFPQPLWKTTSPIRNPLKTWQSANASNRNPGND